MRYDTPVYFQTVLPGEYDPNTGNYGKETISEEKRDASVQNLSIQMLKLMYGSIGQGKIMIQLQNRYNKSFDQIRIRDKIFKVDFIRILRTKQIFIASEVQ